MTKTIKVGDKVQYRGYQDPESEFNWIAYAWVKAISGQSLKLLTSKGLRWVDRRNVEIVQSES